MKIVELSIDDLESFGGLDGIALVENPAHQSNWLAFTESETQIYDILSEEKMGELAFELNKLGEPIGTLEEQGYVLYSIEDAGYETFATINSNPNPDGESDLLPRIRYKYVGIMDKATNRKFCYEMMRANRVFTREDIEQLSSLNSVGPSGYSVLKWRGSYNCKHKWVKLTYLPKDESGSILNKGSARKGLVKEEEGTLYDTRTRATIAAGNTPEPRVGGFTFNVIEVIDDLPYFSTQEEAEKMSSILGCEGFSTWELSNGEIGYAPCNYETFESYDDYPQAASDSACKVLEWIDKYGRDEVAGMELTGLARANQLCKREKISEQTIARMAAFERHRENSKIADEYKGTPWKDRGYVAWMGWGADEGVAWAQRKLESIRKEEFSFLEEDREIDVFGYKTRFFYICPGAISTFEHLKTMNPNEDVIGMIRSAAQIADNVFRIEAEVISKKESTKEDLDQATILVDDFKDLMMEIDELLGMTHDVSYMDGHIKLIKDYLTNKGEFAEVGERGAIVKSPKAPKSDTPNPSPKGEGTAKGDASTTRGAEVSERVENILKEKSDDFNKRYKDKLGYGVNVGMLKSVYQRGVGAYNVSHSPEVKSSEAWALARVNAFLYIVKEGRPENNKYVGDNDLLPMKHPKREMSLDVSGLEPYVSQSGTPISESVYSAVKCNCGDKKPKKQEFKLDDDKMEITGAAIIPNKMIIRRTPPPNSEFYYVFFSEDTTRKLAEKFMKEKLMDKTNIEHTNKKADSYVKESWIIEDPEYDKATALGFNFPKSTWMITMKVSNREIWKKIKEGKLKGFSVEGWFNENLLFN